MPLAFDDAALARIAIGATPIAPHARGRWLHELARRLDPPRRPLTRQGRWRQRQATGAHLPADDQVRVDRAIAAGSESEVAT